MKLRILFQWFFLFSTLISFSFAVGYYSNGISEIRWSLPSNFFAGAALIRNIGLGLFAISAWFFQSILNKTNLLLMTFEVDKNVLTALQLVVSLRDFRGLDKINHSLLNEDKELVKRKMKNLVWIDRIRDLSIVLFVMGICVEVFEILFILP